MGLFVKYFFDKKQQNKTKTDLINKNTKPVFVLFCRKEQ